MIDVMRCALATGRAGTSWQVARAAADPGAPEAEAQEARTKWRRSPHQHTWQLTGHEQVARPAPGRRDGSAKAKYVFIGKLNRGFVARSQPHERVARMWPRTHVLPR